MNNRYEAKTARIFGDMYLKGYIYKGLKPIYWCSSCETALAEAEVEYHNHTSPSVFVAFRIKTDPNGITGSTDGASVVIWTTTPWTLPANLAIAVKEDFVYSLIETDKGTFIIAKELVDSFVEKSGISSCKELKSVDGADLIGIVASHPFIDRESPVILSDHVTLEQGTGCVHIAPGHGQEDFECGLKYGLEIYSPVNHQGKFIDSLPLFGKKYVFSANKDIIAHLDKVQALLHSENIEHSYPHCWRCKTPVIFRATEQWFVDVDKHDMRKQALDKIRRTNWIPSASVNRITSMVENRPDWCLSRQRYWGVPIPVVYCKSCGKDILTEESIKNIERVFLKESSDAWFYRSIKELAGDLSCPDCAGSEFIKETNILDVWFDSGVSHQAVLEQRDELRFPADLYLEGSDQHRGWFQSSLLAAIGCCGESPFKNVLTHGFVVDSDGRKMSKSLGNVISPQDIIDQYGADILRLWVSSVDYTGDVRISQTILTQLSDAYRRIRNTFKYLLGNLNDFDPSKHRVPYDQLDELDRWALSRLTSLGIQTTSNYDNFSLYKIFHTLHHFCVVDMSSFYLDALKDRLYASYENDPKRRSSQTVLYEITRSLISMLAPILVFTAEEVWTYFCKLYPDNKKESIHLCDWPKFDNNLIDTQLEQKFDKILELRTEIQRVLEMLRQDKVIGTSLEAKVIIYSESDEYRAFLQDNKNILKETCIVSQLEISPVALTGDDIHNIEKIAHIKLSARKADGEKCVRCWNYSTHTDCDKNYPGICDRCVDALKNM